MRHAFGEDPARDRALFELLDGVFPGLREGVEELRGLGATWESVSTPFVDFEGGRAISHSGLIELPLILQGRPVIVGSVHAVATHPSHRRRGHCRGLLREMFDHCAGRLATLVLTTGNPEVYLPFGFRVVEEHEFRLPCRGGAGDRPLRRLDLDRALDVALLGRLLATRRPVSDVVGVGVAPAVFLFSEARRPLYHAADLDAVLCLERHDARLDLFDVVAPELPALDALLDALPSGIEELVFHFSPDRFTDRARARSRVFEHDGPSRLMVRGPFAVEGRPFTLPRSGRT